LISQRISSSYFGGCQGCCKINLPANLTYFVYPFRTINEDQGLDRAIP
jgi:hypothetical protein